MYRCSYVHVFDASPIRSTKKILTLLNHACVIHPDAANIHWRVQKYNSTTTADFFGRVPIRKERCNAIVLTPTLTLKLKTQPHLRETFTQPKSFSASDQNQIPTTITSIALSIGSTHCPPTSHTRAVTQKSKVRGKIRGQREVNNCQQPTPEY